MLLLFDMLNDKSKLIRFSEIIQERFTHNVESSCLKPVKNKKGLV